MPLPNNPIRNNPVRKEIYNKALAMLGRRDYGTDELLLKLTDRDFPQEDCEAVLEFLTACGYLNDRRYAERLIEKAHGVYGKRRIVQLLYQHRLDRALIEELMENVDDADTEDEIHEKLVRILRGRPLGDEKELQKLTAKLMRQGYSFEPIRRAILRYAEEGTEE